jgi:zinc protease
MSTSKKKAKAPRTKAGGTITEHRLANGLRVLIVERHFDPIVASILWYGVGARDEQEHESGASHFLEHMMFKGSKRFGKGEVDRLTTLLGGTNNAFTTADHTAYWFEFTSDRWETALEIEADRMRGLLIDPVEFEAEKAVVLEELSMGEDDPWRSLTREVQLVLFPRHGYRRPVIGFADTLRPMDADVLRDYYRRHYRPDNATLVICGDVTPKKALDLVRKRFGSIPRSEPSATVTPRAARSIETVTYEPRGERRVRMTWDDRAHRICMAWPTVRVGTPDDFALDLVATVLTGGRMARLYRRLVLELAVATSISTHNDTHVDPGGFWLYAEAAQGVELAKLEQAIDRELGRLLDEPVSAAELKRAKRILRSSEAYESESVSDLAEEIGEFAIDANWELALDSLELVERVTAREVLDCARRLLTPERRVVGWCEPREAKPARSIAPSRSKAAKRRTTKAARGRR